MGEQRAWVFLVSVSQQFRKTENLMLEGADHRAVVLFTTRHCKGRRCSSVRCGNGGQHSRFRVGEPVFFDAIHKILQSDGVSLSAIATSFLGGRRRLYTHTSPRCLMS